MLECMDYYGIDSLNFGKDIPSSSIMCTTDKPMIDHRYIFLHKYIVSKYLCPYVDQSL
jgi:hypothetical protein